MGNKQHFFPLLSHQVRDVYGGELPPGEGDLCPLEVVGGPGHHGQVVPGDAGAVQQGEAGTSL